MKQIGGLSQNALAVEQEISGMAIICVLGGWPVNAIDRGYLVTAYILIFALRLKERIGVEPWILNIS